ncbi:MAG TPA: hypothetical protein VFT79_04380 [Solirubrobacterales bacterium]|nr:hypothetical protein [Solirubrobacterales bacterium]
MALIEEINRARWTLEFARLGEAEQITEALQTARVVGVLGEAEVGKTETVGQALGNSRPKYPVLHLNLDGVAGEAQVASQLVRKIAVAELGAEFSTLKVGVLVPASLERKKVELAELLGVNGLEEAMRDWPSGEMSLADALTSLSKLTRRYETVLWVDHLEAPSLTPRHPFDLDKLLWALREMVQTHPSLSLVLSGRDAVEGQVLGPEAAFHQQGRWLSLDNPSLEVWRKVASDLKAPEGTAMELADLTAGHPETMLTALLMLSREAPRRDSEELLRELASTSAALASRAFQHACTLHRLGGQVLRQVALGQGPYAISQRGGSPPQEIRKVLGRLRLAGLIRHDDGWAVVNPLIGFILRQEVTRKTAPDWGAEEFPEL